MNGRTVLGQSVLSFREIEAVLCLVQKGVGRFFENDFFNLHFGHAS
jgi:hypothetical protein